MSRRNVFDLNFSFISIRFKVAMGIILILGALTTVFGYIVLQNQRARMFSQLENYGNEMASLMAHMSIMPIKKFSIYQLEDMTTQMESGNNIAFCQIYDQEGMSLVDSSKGQNREKAFLGRPDLMVVEKKILDGDQYLGRVSIGFYLFPLFAEINRVSFLYERAGAGYWVLGTGCWVLGAGFCQQLLFRSSLWQVLTAM